jgi:hypothetical protein
MIKQLQHGSYNIALTSQFFVNIPILDITQFGILAGLVVNKYVPNICWRSTPKPFYSQDSHIVNL